MAEVQSQTPPEKWMKNSCKWFDYLVVLEPKALVSVRLPRVLAKLLVKPSEE